MASAREAKAAELGGVIQRVNTAVSGLSWVGASESAFTQAVSAVVRDLGALSEGLEAQASALRVYAGRVEQIGDRQRVLEAQRAGALARLRVLEGQWASVSAETDAPGSGDGFGGGTRGVAVRVRARIGEEEAVLRSVQAGWEELVAQRGVVDRACVAALRGREVLGATAPLSGGGLLGLAPEKVLQLLAGLSAVDLRVLLAAHPELAEKIAQAGPAAVAAWWNGMNGPHAGKASAAQQVLIGAIPAVIGNLEGVAYWARDKANRVTLTRELRAAEKQVADAKSALRWAVEVGSGSGAVNPMLQPYQDAVQRLSTLEGIAAALKGSAGSPSRYLIELTTGRPPLVAVAIGDLDTARSVTYMVPGMGVDAGSMKGWADSAQKLFIGQGLVGGSSSRAVVAWIGYKAPPVPSVVNLDLGVLGDVDAKAGAALFDRALQGLAVVRSESPVSVNVVAHSYGTTMASVALARSGVHVDSFVSLGSAGIPASVPDAVAIHADHVYAGQARNVIPYMEPGKGDEWAWTGRDFSGRQNPMNPEFGATTFGTDGAPGLKPVTDHSTHVSVTNTGYLDAGTESLQNVALATTGQGDQVTPYSPPALTPLERGLLQFGSGGMPPVGPALPPAYQGGLLGGR